MPMFTGIIEGLGTVARLKSSGRGKRLVVTTDLELKEPVDMTERIGVIMKRFNGKHEFLLLEQHVGTGWLELTIRLLLSS